MKKTTSAGWCRAFHRGMRLAKRRFARGGEFVRFRLGRPASGKCRCLTFPFRICLAELDLPSGAWRDAFPSGAWERQGQESIPCRLPVVIPEFLFRPRMTPALAFCVGGMKMSGISLRWQVWTPMGKRGVHPAGFPARYREGIPDIFIPRVGICFVHLDSARAG